MSTLSLESLRGISVGLLIDKCPRKPLHVVTLHFASILRGKLPSPKWHQRMQGPITLTKSEPEPDIVMVRGNEVDYLTHHPGAALVDRFGLRATGQVFARPDAIPLEVEGRIIATIPVADIFP